MAEAWNLMAPSVFERFRVPDGQLETDGFMGS